MNPGIDLPYQLALPTYAATAWYHHKLPQQHPELAPLLTEVEHFAMNDYAQALEAGSTLSADQRRRSPRSCTTTPAFPFPISTRPTCASAAENSKRTFRTKATQPPAAWIRGSPDRRSIPSAKKPSMIRSRPPSLPPTLSAFNDYVRKDLKYGENKEYKPEIEVWQFWDFKHKPPGAPFALPGSPNVMPDLAVAMKYDPHLKILLNAGYFDLATPFYEGVYEMQHLPIPQDLEKNIEFQFYQSGHMVYAHEASLKAIHDNVAAFIHGSGNSKTK